MRDLFLTLFVMGMVPVSFLRPYYGLLMWAWLTYMNPQRLTWSFAYDFRFNYFIALATLLGLLFNARIRLRIPFSGTTVLIILFTLWTTASAFFALNPGDAHGEWVRFMKIQAMVFVTFIVVKNQRDLKLLVPVITLSFAFYGVKGGFFTVLTGGNFRTLGPAGTFFNDNNTFALALIMVLPLITYMQLQSSSRLLRLGFLGASLLTIAAILGTYSRGGLVGFAALTLAYWWKSKRKLTITIAAIILLPPIYIFMPNKWHDRMDPVVDTFNKIIQTINADRHEVVQLSSNKTYINQGNKNELDEHAEKLLGKDSALTVDMSVQGRFDAWNFAIAVAMDRPILGGGFRAFSQDKFDIYYPGVYRRDAHSIYFEILGEQGFAGLFIWFLLHFAGFANGRWVIRRVRHHPELYWARDMASMIQTGLIGYYASGFFLGLAYFDLPYHFIAILVILKIVTRQELEEIAKRAERERPVTKSIFAQKTQVNRFAGD